MKSILLKIVMLFRGVWDKLGADSNHLEAILRTKILMDGRRSSSFNYKKGDKDLNYTDLLLAFFYLLFGIFGIFFLMPFEDIFTAYSIYYTFWIIILMFTLITDYTEILIDVRDNFILLPTPISGKTLTLSRTLHLFIYLSALIIPFSIPGIIYSVIQYGIGFAFIFFLQCILSLVFAIFLVNIIYLLLLNYTSSQKFKDIIGYFQIGFSVIMFTAYYVFPQFIEKDVVENFSIISKWWSYLLPGSYFAGLPTLLSEEPTNLKLIISAIMGVLIPILSVYLVTNVLSKNFADKLMLLSNDGKEEKTDSNKSITELKGSSYLNFWNNLINSNSVESSSFKMTWVMTGRSRMYKLRTYPMFGMIPAFFFYYAFQSNGNMSEKFQNVQQGNFDIMLLYFALFGIITPLSNTIFSEKYKAASIYKAMPIANPGLIIRGNLKAILIKFGLPIFLFSAMSVFFIWDGSKWANILVGFGNVLLASTLLSFIKLRNIPFSESWDNQSKGSNTITAITVMIFISIIGFAHYLVKDNNWALLGYFIFSIIISTLVYKAIGKINWRQITS